MISCCDSNCKFDGATLEHYQTICIVYHLVVHDIYSLNLSVCGSCTKLDCIYWNEIHRVIDVRDMPCDIAFSENN